MTAPAPLADQARAPDADAGPVDGRPRLPLGAEPPSPTPEPARGWLRRFWFVPASVALLGAAALVPSVGGGGPGAGEARVLVEGVAVVTDAGGGTTTVRADRVDVGPGDEIAIIEGRAVFEMAGDVRLEGLGNHEGRDGTTVEMAIAPRLITGPLLAVAPSPLDIEAGDAVVSIDPSGSTAGAARLDRRLGLGVGTYRGTVAVETAGRHADVPRYRRVEIAAPGALGAEGLPLLYEPDDAWDRQFLGEALVIDAQIGPLLASLGSDERESFLDPATLRRAMPGLPAGADLADRLDDADDGGAALVLAAIAAAVDDRSFADAWARAAAFQDDGAPWGLTAIDQGARSSDVLPTLRAALDTLDLQAPTDGEAADEATVRGAGADRAGTVAGTGGVAGATADPGAAGGPGSAPPSSDTPGGTTDPDPGGGTGTPGLPLPPVTAPHLPPLPPTPNVPEVVGGVGGTVGGVVDDVTDGVDTVVPGVGSTVDGVVDTVGGVVAGAGEVVEGVGTDTGGVLGGVVGGLGTVTSGLGSGLAGPGGR